MCPERNKKRDLIFILSIFLTSLLVFDDALLAQENSGPIPSVNSEEKKSEKTGLAEKSDASSQKKELSQGDIREKFRNQLGGFGYERYFSVDYTFIINRDWAVGMTGYQNAYVNRFDSDVAYSVAFPANTFYGRIRNYERKTWGGALYLQRYLYDSPFFVSFWLGREHMRREASSIFWESAGSTYRWERSSVTWGPQTFAGFGLGLRFQTESRFFWGWEGVWSWYFPYKNSYQVSDLGYSNRVADLNDLYYRIYSLKNYETKPGSSFGLNIVIGIAF
ncbi:hypothetical protein CH373_02155 [Leptospira perolatii]|uniref:DUF3575 domain-containing protein n=1 Tax=Leptospira perolatii TaxID=2023191 RepID=A0A2M9ZSG2_9LEPT|nr:hypothetical protein [Leptospira perolatii]PJZ71329.1 hypothetical protein CH360_02155 [Leptospira perolatii]PJZ74863.1 hypothetical protein CH373_02155 [Leptospira perolatii]